jgi:transposase
MASNLRLSSLIPDGLIIDGSVERDGGIVVSVRAKADEQACPQCGKLSSRIHSRYVRTAADLPFAGKKVALRLVTRRFVCNAPSCPRRIFAERFAGIIAERARRTSRLECIVHHLGLALGGRPAASFAKRLMMPVSNDTLLRVVRRRAKLPGEPLNVIGIDDWAWRRNHRYGTIICDLERRQIVALLADREIATVQAWLTDHPGISVVSRDRGGGYGEAASKALPHVVQVADRWHLMENASAAFLDAVRKSMASIRSAIGATTINPKLLTCAEKLQYEGYLRREETNAAIIALAGEGVAIKDIVRRTGHSRKLVRQVIRAKERICSGFGRARLRSICRCWMSCRTRAAAMEPNLAAHEGQRLPRRVACRERMGNPAPSRRSRVRDDLTADRNPLIGARAGARPLRATCQNSQ